MRNAAPRDSVLDWRTEAIELPLAAQEGLEGLVTRLRRWLRGLPFGEAHEFLRALEGHLKTAFDWSRRTDQLRPLRWSEIKTMQRSGPVTFGSHTVSNAVLSGCSENIQRFEAEYSKQRLEEELGTCCDMFAYPCGKAGCFTANTRQIVQNAGYALGVTAEAGCNDSSTEPYELHRWRADMSMDELKSLITARNFGKASVVH